MRQVAGQLHCLDDGALQHGLVVHVREQAAFVLAYRVRPTPAADADFEAEINREIAERAASPRGLASDKLHFTPAVDDARQAMRWLRAQAGALGIDAARLGFLGFSAGAHSGHTLVETANPDEMPATLALVYGGLQAAEPRAPVPPLFLAQAADDPLFPLDGFDLVQSWRRARQRVELHVYERGGHGFGSIPRGSTSDRWMDHYLAWLDRQ